LFFPEKTLKNLIISYVKEEERSISGLARQLNKDGHSIHRLFLTGYLRALADMGVVREKQIPPSKVYATSANRERNIYEMVGDKCKSAEVSDREKPELAVSVLEELFHRPVFLQELRECGFEDVVAPTVKGDERSEARKLLVRSGIEIPGNDPAYTSGGAYEEPATQVLRDLVLERFDVNHLRVDTKQIKLDDLS
jgi:DNA-binding HxlR family transcriptional regulator